MRRTPKKVQKKKTQKRRPARPSSTPSTKSIPRPRPRPTRPTRPTRPIPRADLTAAQLVRLAKDHPDRLTPRQSQDLVRLKRARDSGSKSAYEKHKARVGQRQLADSRAARDIGPLPDVADPARRAAALASLKTFLETYFSGVFPLAWSDDHLRTIAKIERAAVKGELFALATPRGFGKTSIIERAAIWVALKGLRSYVALIAATRAKAVDILNSIKVELEFNDLLAADFPECCHPIRALEGIHQRSAGQTLDGRQTSMTWQADKLVLPTVTGSDASGSIFHVAGLTGAGVRGLKHTLTRDDGTTAIIRPSFAMLDDPQTRESANSRTQSERREAIIKGDVLFLAGPAKKIAGYCLCTVIAPDDLADRLLDRKRHPDWQGERLKMVYKFPANEKLWTEYGELRADLLRRELPLTALNDFYLAHQPAMDAGSLVAWPARHNPDEISALQSAMNLRLRDEASFFAEYQNEPMVDADLTVALKPEEICSRTSGYARRTVPVKSEHLTAFIDVHDKMLFYVIAAWSTDFTGSIIDYGTWPDQHQAYFSLRQARSTLAMHSRGASREGAILAGLEKLAGEIMARPFVRSDGAEMRVGQLLIDAGYVRDVVYAFCRSTTLKGLFPSHGRPIGPANKPMADYIRRPGDRLSAHWMITAAQRGERVRHVLTDTYHWKSFIHARLAMAKGDPGALTLYGTDPIAHRLIADHILAEDPRPTAGPWGAVEVWKERPDHPDNHWFDCLVGCCAAASILGAQVPGTQIAPRVRKRITLAELKSRAGK